MTDVAAASDSDALEDHVRRAIATRRLPASEAFRRLVTQRGSTAPCVVCESRIARADREYEITDSDGMTYHVHPACFSAWMTVLGAGRRPAR